MGGYPIAAGIDGGDTVMAYTQPVLGSSTLPHPSEYKETPEWRGAMATMADGSAAFDVVNTNAKKTYTLTWRAISDADRGTIQTAWDALKTASVSFTPPTGDGAVTVTRTETGPTFEVVKAASGLRWNATLELRQV